MARAVGNQTLEWVTPVLYLRGHQTRLFALRHPPALMSLAPCPYPRGRSRDGRIAARCAQQTRHPTTPAAFRTLAGHQDGVWGVAFSPDGQLLATADHDNTTRLRD